MKKRSLIIFLALVLCFTMFACGSSDSSSSTDTGSTDAELSADSTAPDKTYIIKLAHVLPDSSASHLAMVRFKEIVQEKTNGGIEVQLFSNSALGNERDINENLNNGSIQMIYASPGSMGAAIYPDLQILDAPWLFENSDHAMAVARNEDSPLAEIIQGIYDSTNVQILDMWYRAPRHFFTKSTAIEIPADCKGVKLRSPDIDVYFGSLNAIGFAVTPVAYAETYSALQTGVVEGLEGPLDLTWGMKFQEVTKYLCKAGWNSGLGPVAINKDFFNSLPADYQTILKEAVIEAGDYNTEKTLELDANLEQNFIDAGLTVVEPDMEAFYAMVPEIIPTISHIWNDNGRNLYDKIHNYDY